MVDRPHKTEERNTTSKSAETRRRHGRCHAVSALQRGAVSTGQAARYCFVSSGAILNWIADGQLPAQRTIGGQNRILVADLRAFMLRHGMSTARLDCDVGQSSVCWEFFSTSVRGAAPALADGCAECPVFRSGASLCHELRPFLPGGTLRAPACARCDFAAARRESTSKEQAP
jgi:excisionase family DNA binding protein